MAPTQADQGWSYSIRDDEDPSDTEDSPAPALAPAPRPLTEQDLLVAEAEEEGADEQDEEREIIDIGEVQENITFVETPFSIAARLAGSRRRKEHLEREDAGWELEPTPSATAVVPHPPTAPTKLNPLQRGFLRQAALASTRSPPAKRALKVTQKSRAADTKARKELPVAKGATASEGSGAAESGSTSEGPSLPARVSNARTPLARVLPHPTTPTALDLRPSKRQLSPKRVTTSSTSAKPRVPLAVPQPQLVAKKAPTQVYKFKSIPPTIPLPRPLVENPPPLVPRISKRGPSSRLETALELSDTPSTTIDVAFRPAMSLFKPSPHHRPPERPLTSSPPASPGPAHPASSTSDSSSHDSSLLRHSRPTSYTTSSPTSSPQSRPEPSYCPLLLHSRPAPSPRHKKLPPSSPAQTWSTLTPNLLPAPSFYGSALPSSTSKSTTALATKFALPGLAGPRKAFQPAESLVEFNARMRREEERGEAGKGREEVVLGTAVRSFKGEEKKGKSVYRDMEF